MSQMLFSTSISLCNIVLGFFSAPIVLLLIVLGMSYSPTKRKRPIKKVAKESFQFINKETENEFILNQGWLRITESVNSNEGPTIMEKMQFLVKKNWKTRKQSQKKKIVSTSEKEEKSLSPLSSPQNTTFANRLSSYYKKIAKKRSTVIMPENDPRSPVLVEEILQSPNANILDRPIDQTESEKAKKNESNKPNSRTKLKTDNLQQFGWYYGVIKKDGILYLYSDDSEADYKYMINLRVYQVSLIDAQDANNTNKDNLTYLVNKPIVLYPLLHDTNNAAQQNTFDCKDSQETRNKTYKHMPIYIHSETPVEKEDWFISICELCSIITINQEIQNSLFLKKSKWLKAIPSLFEKARFQNFIKELKKESDQPKSQNNAIILINSVINRIIMALMNYNLLFYNLKDFIRKKLLKVNKRLLILKTPNISLNFHSTPVSIDKHPEILRLNKDGNLLLKVPLSIGKISVKIESNVKLFKTVFVLEKLFSFLFHLGLKIKVKKCRLDLYLSLSSKNLNVITLSAKNFKLHNNNKTPFFKGLISSLTSGRLSCQNDILTLEASANIGRHRFRIPSFVNYIASNVTIAFLNKIEVKLLPDKEMICNSNTMGYLNENVAFSNLNTDSTNEKNKNYIFQRFSFLGNTNANTKAEKEPIKTEECPPLIGAIAELSQTSPESEPAKSIATERKHSVPPPLTDKIMKKAQKFDKTPSNSLTSLDTFAEFHSKEKTDAKKCNSKANTLINNLKNIDSNINTIKVRNTKKEGTPSNRRLSSSIYERTYPSNMKDRFESEIRKKRPPSLYLSTQSLDEELIEQ